MMKLPTVTGITLIPGLLLFSLSGCDKGPAEQAGEDIDDAFDRAVDSMEQAGDNIRDAGRDARD